MGEREGDKMDKFYGLGEGSRTICFPNSIVILGLDPRTLHLPSAQRVESPRVKPEGDGRWVG